jgi:Cu/Ag efflux protein CusF
MVGLFILWRMHLAWTSRPGLPFLLATAVALVTAGRLLAAASGEQQPPRGVAQQVSVVAGEVEEVDRTGRTVTIRSGNTIQAPIYVGPDMPIFDQLNRGDVVTIRYYDAIIVELTPGARMAPPKDTTADAQQKVQRPDAAVLQQVSIVVTVDSIDRATGMVTYHDVSNRRVQRLVQYPALIEGLKPGDVVTIRQTRAQAASIETRP